MVIDWKSNSDFTFFRIPREIAYFFIIFRILVLPYSLLSWCDFVIWLRIIDLVGLDYSLVVLRDIVMIENRQVVFFDRFGGSTQMFHIL